MTIDLYYRLDTRRTPFGAAGGCRTWQQALGPEGLHDHGAAGGHDGGDDAVGALGRLARFGPSLHHDSPSFTRLHSARRATGCNNVIAGSSRLKPTMQGKRPMSLLEMWT